MEPRFGRYPIIYMSDFSNLSSRKATGKRTDRGLLPFEIMEILSHELSTPRFMSECTPSYIETIREFVTENIAGRLANMRQIRGMFDALEREEEWDAETDLSLGASSNSS